MLIAWESCEPANRLMNNTCWILPKIEENYIHTQTGSHLTHVLLDDTLLAHTSWAPSSPGIWKNKHDLVVFFTETRQVMWIGWSVAALLGGSCNVLSIFQHPGPASTGCLGWAATHQLNFRKRSFSKATWWARPAASGSAAVVGPLDRHGSDQVRDEGACCLIAYLLRAWEHGERPRSHSEAQRVVQCGSQPLTWLPVTTPPRRTKPRGREPGPTLTMSQRLHGYHVIEKTQTGIENKTGNRWHWLSLRWPGDAQYLLF